MNLFIDTNIYLTFFHFTNEDLEELKKLKTAIGSAKIKLLLTDQVQEEFKRNREVKIADALKKFNAQNLPDSFPQICKEYEQYQKLVEKRDEFRKIKSELLEQLKNNIQAKTLGADIIIKELFSVATNISVTEEILRLASNRFQKGNPPGKKGSYGDAISWESLLSFSLNGDLHFVTNDDDYVSPIDNSIFSEFLHDEWAQKKNSAVRYYKNLSSFFTEHFPTIKLASDFEKQAAISELVNSSYFSHTHSAISKLTKYTDLTREEVLTLVDACLCNPQIYWIASDDDVHEFISGLLQNHQHVIPIDKFKTLSEQFTETFPNLIKSDF